MVEPTNEELLDRALGLSAAWRHNPDVQPELDAASAAVLARMAPQWRPIETAPTTCEQILVGFQGQFRWMSFVANAFGAETQALGYARPTHWQPIDPPTLAPQSGKAK